MEVMLEDSSLSTAVFLEEYLEDLALRLTALVSIAVIHQNLLFFTMTILMTIESIVIHCYKGYGTATMIITAF